MMLSRTSILVCLTTLVVVHATDSSSSSSSYHAIRKAVSSKLHLEGSEHQEEESFDMTLRRLSKSLFSYLSPHDQEQQNPMIRSSSSSSQEQQREAMVRTTDYCLDETKNICNQFATCTSKLFPVEGEDYVTCECIRGYVGTGIRDDCVDYNECENEYPCPPADEGGYCVDHDPDDEDNPYYWCGCEEGYEGSMEDGTFGYTVCTQIDECDEGTHDCDPNNGMCIDTPGSYTCACETGYELVPGNSKTCRPIPQVDPCKECRNANGKDECINDQCVCKTGYEGSSPYCKDINECDANPCNEYAMCINQPGSFTCICPTGFVKDGFLNCVNENECNMQNVITCGANAICTDLTPSAQNPAKFSCACMPGYEGDGYSDCTDVDECATMGAAACTGVNTVCRDVVGGYACDCVDGWTLNDNGECLQDINECGVGPPFPCKAEGLKCINSQGSYSCIDWPDAPATDVTEGFVTSVDTSNTEALTTVTTIASGNIATDNIVVAQVSVFTNQASSTRRTRDRDLQSVDTAVAFNGGGDPAFLTEVNGGIFNIISLQAAGAWRKSLKVRFTGLDDMGAVVAGPQEETMVDQAQQFRLVTLNFSNIHKLQIESYDGTVDTAQFQCAAGTHVLIDSLQLSFPPPP